MSKYNLTDIFEQYQIGSGWTKDFDYEGMLNAGLKTRAGDDIEKLKEIFEDFTDVNYHREAEHLSYAIDALEEGDAFEAEGKISDFHDAIRKTMEDLGMDMSDDLGAFMASKMEEGNKKEDMEEGKKQEKEDKDKEPRDGVKSAAAKLGMKPKHVKEVRIDRDVAERIEGMLSIPLKRKFLDAFMDLWQDLIEEDPFYAEDVINHLNNEMHKEIDGYQATGDKLAGLEEDTAMSGAIADEEEAGAIGTHLAEDKVAMKDVVLAIIKDTNATNPEVQMYVDSLTNDIKLNGKEAYADYEVDDYIEDFRNYIADKSLQEHFGRFMKDYQ